MNLTLSIDDRLAQAALRVARARGTSLDQMIREALERITSIRSSEGVMDALESQWRKGGGWSDGATWDREELYDRPRLR